MSTIGTHLITLYINGDNITYSFGIEHIPKEIKKLINNKNIKTKIYGIQENDSIMCGYFCIELINIMRKVRNLSDNTNLYYPNEFFKKARK